jgi:HEAT repeat protein
MGLFGPPDVEKMKAKHDVNGLVKAMGYKNDVVIREKALEALCEIDMAHAVEPLIAVLKDANSHVRRVAADALGA